MLIFVFQRAQKGGQNPAEPRQRHAPGEQTHACTPRASCALVSKGKPQAHVHGGRGTPKIRPQLRRTGGGGGWTCLDAGIPALGPDDEPESQVESLPFTGTKHRFGVTLQGYCSP